MILAFESFLANNVEFGSLNEIIHYIDNIVSEAPSRKYKDADILDEDITLEESFFKVMATCGFDGYYPDQRDLTIVWNLMSNLNQEDINRIFYKNNLYYFMDNASMTNMMEYMLCKLKAPFMDPNEAPKEIEVELETFWDIMSEYVYYGYQYMDRMGRVDTMIRKTCIIADTDSSIISLDAWYRYNAAKYYNVPMTIKRTLYKPLFEQEYDEFGDPVKMVKAMEHIEEEMDYNFLTNEEYVSGYKLAKPFIIDPQEGFRYSIINIIAYCLSKMIVDYLRRYCKQTNSINNDRAETACYAVAKNEFLFKRVLVVAQKNYCDIQELQEGNIVPKDRQFTIMGMPINKSTLSDYTKQELQKILYEDILMSPEIDQLTVLKKLCIFERKIIESIRSGKREYFKPQTVKSINNYDDPMRIFGVKASIVYNALKDNEQETLDLQTRNNVDIVKLNISLKDLPKIEEIRPDKVGQISELLSMKQFKDGIDAMALPLNETIPEWLLDFIDYTEVINTNMKNFPLEQIGISKIGKDTVNYSNILQV